MHSRPCKTRFGRAAPAAAAVCAALLLAAAPSASASPAETVLYAFAGGLSDGYDPEAGLILDGAGNLYGTTRWGGAYALGVAFKLAPNGAGGYTETVLHAFAGSDGAEPQAALILDGAGNLYGTTQEGSSVPGVFPGYGVVFKLAPNGAGGYTETVLYAFTGGSDGAYPSEGLTLDGAGNLYGTTLYSGSGGPGTVGVGGFGNGVAFKLAPDGTFTVLHAFTGGGDGALPFAGLILDPAGNLYGTAGGGASNAGVAFKLAPDGTFTVLYAFAGGSDGAGPGSLILDGAGNLYGTAGYGGAYGQGAVFKLAPNGAGGYAETVLHAFTGGGDGAFPKGGLIADAAGNLYGTTGEGGSAPAPSGNGVAFKLSPDGTSYTVLHAFTGGSDGDPFLAGLIADDAGNLYGTTASGGAYGQGAVFKLAGAGFVTMPVQVPLPLVPPSQLAATASGLAYSRVSQTFNGTLTLTNVSAGAIGGPLQIVFTGLSAGVTLANATGTFAGTPYLTVPAVTSLPPGQSVTLSLQFKDPSNAPITFTPAIYSGNF